MECYSESCSPLLFCCQVGVCRPCAADAARRWRGHRRRCDRASFPAAAFCDKRRRAQQTPAARGLRDAGGVGNELSAAAGTLRSPLIADLIESKDRARKIGFCVHTT